MLKSALGNNNLKESMLIWYHGLLRLLSYSLVLAFNKADAKVLLFRRTLIHLVFQSL